MKAGLPLACSAIGADFLGIRIDVTTSPAARISLAATYRQA